MKSTVVNTIVILCFILSKQTKYKISKYESFQEHLFNSSSRTVTVYGRGSINTDLINVFMLYVIYLFLLSAISILINILYIKGLFKNAKGV